MQKTKTFLSLFLICLGFFLGSCEKNIPTAKCAAAGKFVMTLKNEEGKIVWDKEMRRFYIHISPDGSLKYNTRAFPCSLDAIYSDGQEVIFDGDFFEIMPDSFLLKNDFIVQVNKIALK